MSIATVVTMGYGSFGSVNKLPTIGYTQAAVIANTVFGEGVEFLPQRRRLIDVDRGRAFAPERRRLIDEDRNL